MSDIIKIPTLLIGFNRPDVIKETFSRIRESKPQKLYVAIDGARNDKQGEEKLVDEVKAIVQNVDWPCETHYRFNEINKGAEITISSAISWVFETEEYAIILEDDIIAPMAFLKFAQEMLIRYKHDERIGIITGSNFTPIPVPNNTDYFFARYGHTGGGWATWRREWKDYDLNFEVSSKYLKKSFLNTVCNNSAEVKYFRKRFKKMQKRGAGNNTWDEVEFFYQRVNNRLSITPRTNLTSNIGINGLHARGSTEHHFRSYDEDFKVYKHPKVIESFYEYDNYHFRTYINIKTPLTKRVFRRLRKIICS